MWVWAQVRVVIHDSYHCTNGHYAESRREPFPTEGLRESNNAIRAVATENKTL